MELTTTYLGLELKNPLIASASPLTASLDSIKKLEENGIAAVIMHSLFEEEINHEIHQIDHFLHIHSDSNAEATSYLPSEVDFDNLNSEQYLEEIRKIKGATQIPIIASLNGVSAGGWVKYAKKLQEAGADALELNITYIPTSIDMGGNAVEQMYIDTVAKVKEHISIPLNVKMNAYFSSPANMAKRFVEAGANGLTIFDNPARVDVDLELLTALQRANITSSTHLSETLRWCAILYKKLPCSLCANTGIHSAEDVLKAIMSGADVVALASVLLMKGESEVVTILNEITQWMEKYEYDSITQMKGSISLAHTDNPAAYERNSYMYALQQYRR
ncbi:MAG: dihydroorotate dehydrogenase-like protein [Sulfurovum sp.]|jgi:dihydroorotate dehydrogenase (fumarate)|uniref:dihydroorotate dehydrogenase-like protein n=1 Tax=Sulfurovum sp. TaxID=1969726 RepID=UPI003C794C8A